MRRFLLVAFLLLAAACTSGTRQERAITHPARLLFAGGVDTAGAVASIAAADPEGLFRDVRFVVRGADLAVIGPLTGPAPEEIGALLAAAGFDAVLAARVSPQVPPLPAGTRVESAVLTAGSLGVAVLYVDAGRMSIAEQNGGAWSSPARSRLAPDATIVFLGGPPGGTGAAGPVLARLDADVVIILAGADAPLAVVESPGGRRSVLASGLGPLLSADESPGGPAGMLLEVLVDDAGVISYRVGRTTHADLRVHFTGWDLPSGDAALLDGEWWQLVRPVQPAPAPVSPITAAFDRGDLIAAALGDVTGDGIEDIAASYRHPFRPSAVSETWPGAVPVDALGRSAHLGVFDLEWRSIWLAGRVPRPIGALAACDGSVALAYNGLDDPGVVATGAAVWQGFGLRPARELPGPGVPGCADVDGDGRLDPLILGRSS